MTAVASTREETATSKTDERTSCKDHSGPEKLIPVALRHPLAHGTFTLAEVYHEAVYQAHSIEAGVENRPEIEDDSDGSSELWTETA
jgi:hypothetical protein